MALLPAACNDSSTPSLRPPSSLPYVNFSQATTDKANGRKPLRRPIVSSTIVMNTMYWISNLVSTVWMVIIPIQIG